MVSALTLLGLDVRMAAHASYEALADIVRARFTAPVETLKELFARMTFNILVGNTDDHARNHATFWDGEYFTLTPAYDIPDYVQSSARSGGLTRAAVFLGSRASSPQTVLVAPLS